MGELGVLDPASFQKNNSTLSHFRKKVRPGGSLVFGLSLLCGKYWKEVRNSGEL